MTNILGAEIPLPEINLTGIFSSTWIYIGIVLILGIILIIGVVILLYMRTYNRKIVVFENISGQGYQPVLKTRARIVKLGSSGEEILKTLVGKQYVTAYGRKMGKNTYWFAKGADGYWYNIILGDLDTKMNLLDIEPVDRDVRMFHVALDRLSHLTYGKQSFMEKYGTYVISLLLLVVLLAGMWFIVGKVGDSTAALTATAATNERVVELLGNVLQQTDNIQTGITNSGSGLVPAG